LNSERVARLEEMLHLTERHVELLQSQLQFEKEAHAGVESVQKIAGIEQRLEGVHNRQGVNKCIGRIKWPYTDDR
jgi:hypothetical protein